MMSTAQSCAHCPSALEDRHEPCHSPAPPPPQLLADSSVCPSSIILSLYQCCINGFFSFLRIMGTFSRATVLFISSISVYSSKYYICILCHIYWYSGIAFPHSDEVQLFYLPLPSFIYNIIPLDISSTCIKNASGLWLLLQSSHSV